MERSDIIESLYPKKISINEFEKVINEIKIKIKDKNSISNVLKEYNNIPYYFKKEGKYISTNEYMPTITDASHLYVLIDYIVNYNKGTFDREKSYREFLNPQWNDIKEFIYKVSIDSSKKVNIFNEIDVSMIKGSIYKIKKYFLENSKLKDIRGASAILDYINIDVALNYLRKNFIEECAIYCGGGNVLLLIPGRTDKNVCRDLEEEYSSISLTAKSCFEKEDFKLSSIVNEYSKISTKVTIKLDERKKLKLYPINPNTNIKGINIQGEYISFEGNKSKNSTVCKLCGIRESKYETFSPDGVINVCPSCFRKNIVGNKIKSKFYKRFEEIIKRQPEEIDSVSELGDSNGNIGVIYADGNNMGAVVMNIRTPFENMYFSRTLEYITENSVYEAINEVMQDEILYEAVALGGDDIFIIIPGEYSMEVSGKIIEKFDKAFNNKMTMSVGVCVGKCSTPIRNMLNIAQEALDNAKKYIRKKEVNQGSIDIVSIKEGDKSGLFPVKRDKIPSIIKHIKEMRKDKDIKSSQIYKLKYAASSMTENEFKLFYLYNEARHSKKYTEYCNKIFELDKNKIFDGLINKIENNKKSTFSPWDELTLLMDCIGGMESGKN
ncbi:CRISPR/Cas system-associated protein Cas10, large subunit of type III CRISPR-Cas systems, contains HD superfamily nuclease domain [Clostridium cochlearium]|uniref:CRISPR/Cas system-associated protein Cas10, large subunit of type III CRISPR-Cas systems, contains HD superfamily nuclease domain n=1 Tax=Clostridium cochlearium TaxID=1494 RepID=A0ABY0QP24_CLOCO|nr:hypothetical protein [Clostridium cochlearium]SDL41791.1 CRISPR/Cas system-associated protein Cas10, large subunit of type III CRISPR-Cas systems, contains HD superfamily nuclease domain [Clostridium cochlearium]